MYDFLNNFEQMKVLKQKYLLGYKLIQQLIMS